MIIVSIVCIIITNSQCIAFDNDELIVSNGSSLISYSIYNNQLSKTSTLLDVDEWSYVTWPSYDEKNNIIYFEAQNRDYGFSSMIFAINHSLIPEKTIKVVEGRRPSISMDGNLLCYYRHPNQLWMMDINNQDNRLLVSNFADYQPVVWISNQLLLYSDIDNHLVKLDVSSGTVELTGHDFLIPGALSPKRDQVLCGSYDGKTIFLYTIKTNKLSKIKKTSIISMGSSFVWSHDAKQYLYTRQTFSNLIKLNESHSLFLYSSKDKEFKLKDKFALFGGFCLK